METQTAVLNVLVLAAFGLLTVVTVGIVYLSAADWRDRRRQDQELRSAKTTKKQSSAKTTKKQR